jgi:hypothetical protein
VDDQLRALDEFLELSGHGGETRLVGEEGVGDAVHLDGAGIDVALRVDVAVKVAPREAPVLRVRRSRSR